MNEKIPTSAKDSVLLKLRARVDAAWPLENRRKVAAKAKRFGRNLALTVTAVGAMGGANHIALANGVDTPVQGYGWVSKSADNCIYTYMVVTHPVQPGEKDVAMHIVPFVGDPSEPENRRPAQIVDLTGKALVVRVGIETCFPLADFPKSGVEIFAENNGKRSTGEIYRAEVGE